MADNSATDNVSEIVTKFLLSTYRLQPTKHDMFALELSMILANGHPDDHPEADVIPLLSGSSVELYIKPMLPCVHDIDVMYFLNTQLAIPAGYSAPTELPDEFHSRVMVCEITDTDYPGYVYLKTRYFIQTENNDNGKYKAVLRDRPALVFHRLTPSDGNHGPAQLLALNSPSLSIDTVRCIRCLSWPPQAADWPTRHRNYDWPDSETVDRVVSNGCDVVLVAHRLCRQAERESERQWRLSFSRAEVVLLNSWTPIQQIVYHMLRFFAKSVELTSDQTGTNIISNYNIKTLMLWACELKPISRWIADANVVRICMELMHTLAVSLTDAHCQHYFVADCNLMDIAVHSNTPIAVVGLQLMSVTESWLSTWFVNKYILKCAQFCPDNVSRLFDDVSTNVKLQTAASAVVDWRRNTTIENLRGVHLTIVHHVEDLCDVRFQTMYSSLRAMKEWTKLSQMLADFIRAYALLRCARTLTTQHLTVELMDSLSILCEVSINRRRHSSQRGSVLLLGQAAKLMKVVANNSRSTVQLIEIELSKAYLCRALRCKDSDNDSIYCLANVYLAVLYFTTGQYQTAIDHCTLVTMSQDHSQCSSHVVQGELLPKIDDDIDSVLGLAVFYRYLRTAALTQKQRDSAAIRILTTKLFACHLFTKCLSAIKCHQFMQTPSADEVERYYKKCLEDCQGLLTEDVLLYKLIHILPKLPFHNKSLVYRRRSPSMSPTEPNTSDLVELLQQSAVELLTTFRQLEAREFCSVDTIVTTDFDAMYEYKRGNYQLCLQLSTRNVRTLWYARHMTGVNTHSEFIQLLDDDIVSLTALTLIVNPKCRNRFVNAVISQLTLSLYLMTQCQLKLHHSATQLAQTLQYVQVAQRKHTADSTLNHLVLKLTKCKALAYVRRY